MSKVRIVKRFSADEFIVCHINQLSHLEAEISQCMGDDLRSTISVVSATCGEHYSVFREQKWRRFKVKRVLERDRIHGYFPDYGTRETIGIRSLRRLPEHLKMEASCLDMVKIRGLKPVGMNIVENVVPQSDIYLKSTLTPVKQWTNAALRFVDNVLMKNPIVTLRDGDIYVMVNREETSLSALLVENGYAVYQDIADDISTPGTTQHSLGEYLTDTDSAGEACIRRGTRLSPNLLRPSSASECKGPTSSSSGSHCSSPTDLDKTNSLRLSPRNDTAGSPVSVSGGCLEPVLPEEAAGLEALDLREVELRVCVRGPQSVIPKPILSYNEPRLVDFIRRCLNRHDTRTLMFVQTYLIPAVLRGLDVVAVAPGKKGKTCGLLMALLNRLSSSALDTSGLPSGPGPMGIVVCPSWVKAKECADFAVRFIRDAPRGSKSGKLVIRLAYGGEMDVELENKLMEGCDLLMITPRCLVRYLRKRRLVELNRLLCLVFDDFDVMAEQYLEEIREIMCFRRAALVESGKGILSRQLVATATEWRPSLASFVRHEMQQSVEIFDSRMEAALRVRMRHYIREVSDNEQEKLEQLVKLVRNLEPALTRGIVFCSDDVTTVSVCNFLRSGTHSASNLILMTNEMTAEEVAIVEEKWREFDQPGSKPLLVMCDRVFGPQSVHIDNADWVIHYDCSVVKLHARLFTMRSHFPDYVDPEDGQERATSGIQAKSFFFLCKETMEPAAAEVFLRYLPRCGTDVPEWVKDMVVQNKVKMEAARKTNDLCNRLKSYGECHIPSCRERHMILPEVDRIILPNCGEIKFNVLHLESASHFYIRILEHRAPRGECTDYTAEYKDLILRMNNHYVEPENHCGFMTYDIKPGLLATIQTQDHRFHRVRVDKTKPGRHRGERSTAEVFYVDEGRKGVVFNSGLLRLPEDLAGIPGQAIPVHLAGIRPIDGDVEFTHSSTDFTKVMVKDKEMHGRIVLSLGNTLWLDSVSQLVFHKATSMYVYDHKLRVELLQANLAEENPGHIERLYALCQGKVDVPDPAQLTPVEGCEAAPRYATRRFTYAFKEVETATFDEDAETIQCLIGTNNSPELFYLVQDANWDDIWALQDEATALIDSIRPYSPGELTPGCLALVHIDYGEQSEEPWRRARILSVDEDHIRVLLVDIGEEAVCIGMNRIRRLPVEYKQLPLQAIECSLGHCVPIANTSPEDIRVAMDNFCFTDEEERKPLSVRVLAKRQPGHYVVEVRIINGPDMAEFLIEQGLAMGDQAMAGELFPEALEVKPPLMRARSVPHLAFDIFLATGKESRCRLLKKLGQACQRRVTGAQLTVHVSCLVSLVKFLRESEEVGELYNILGQVVTQVTYSAEDEEDGRAWLKEVDFMSGLMSHLSRWAGEERVEGLKSAIDLLEALAGGEVGTRMQLTEVTYWVPALTTALKVLAQKREEELFVKYADVCILLLVVANNKTDCIQLMRESCQVLRVVESVNIWMKAIELIDMLSDKRYARTVFKDEDLANVLWDRFLGLYQEVGAFTPFHQLCVVVVMKLWTCGWIKRSDFVRRNSPSQLEKIAKEAKNEDLCRLYVEMCQEESRLPSTKPKLLVPGPEAALVKRDRIYKPVVLSKPPARLDHCILPDVKWFERRKTVFIIISVQNSHQKKRSPVSLTKESLHFRFSTLDGEVKAFDLELHAAVDTNKCVVKCGEFDVRVRLRKVLLEPWYRLSKMGTKARFIRRDPEHLGEELDEDNVVSSSSSDDEDPANRPFFRRRRRRQSPHQTNGGGDTGVTGDGAMGGPDSDVDDWVSRGRPTERAGFRLVESGESDQEDGSSDSDVDVEGLRSMQRRKGNPADEDEVSHYYNL